MGQTARFVPGSDTGQAVTARFVPGCEDKAEIHVDKPAVTVRAYRNAHGQWEVRAKDAWLLLSAQAEKEAFAALHLLG